MMSILQLKNVNKNFGGLKAVREVSFDVQPVEIFGIAGPNGAGKTTLFNVITGLLPSKGDIFFNGINIAGLRPHKICRLGMVRTFQMPNIFSTLSVFESVKLACRYGGSGTKVDRLLEQMITFVGLEGKEHYRSHQLDLFDKKRTMLAANLATNPELLLLDEPIAGLSLPQVRESVRLIRKIRDELGVTIMIIEHFMNILTEISERLMILHEGAIICTGDPQTVVHDSQVVKVYTGAGDAGSK